MTVTTSIDVEFLDQDLQIEPMNPMFLDTMEVVPMTSNAKLVTTGELDNSIEKDRRSLKDELAVMREVDSATETRRNEVCYVAVDLHFEGMRRTCGSMAYAWVVAEELAIGLVLCRPLLVMHRLCCPRLQASSQMAGAWVGVGQGGQEVSDIWVAWELVLWSTLMLGEDHLGL